MDHVSIRVRDLGASCRFYEAALAPLGFGVVQAPEGGAAFGVEGTDDFTIIRSATRDRAAVDAFYGLALEAGGRDNGAPGLRPEYHVGYYAAFVLGPDGNNVEADAP